MKNTRKENVLPLSIPLGVEGARFLRLTRAQEFVLSGHALDRLEEHAGFRPTRALAHHFFSRARHVRIDALRLLGYRPAYDARVARGVQSWYFRFRVFGQAMIAVVTSDPGTGSYTWVTTYGAPMHVEIDPAIPLSTRETEKPRRAADAA